jgi:hypothetical protein
VATVIADRRAGEVSTREGLACLHQGKTWVESASGDGVLHRIPLIPGPGTDLLVDQAVALWISTEGPLPVLRFSEERLTCWDELDPYSGAWSVAETQDGRVWAILDGGMSTQRSSSGIRTRMTRSVTLDVQSHVALTPDGLAWLGDRAGLYMLLQRQTTIGSTTWGEVKQAQVALPR